VSTLDEALRRLAGQARSDGVLVALDFDGVLAPLVDDPATSRPLPEASRALDRLAAASVHLAVVSGRPLADVARLSRPPSGTIVVGSHGAERGTWTDGRLETVELALDPAEADLLAELGTRLAAQVAGSTGRLERKPAAVVVHTRTATPDDAARLTAAALALGDRDGVDVLRGKNVIELSVLDVTKGRALETLRSELAVQGLLYAGDDVTDERAFTALRPQDVTVKVGPGTTAARWRVADPAELAAVLGRLADLVERGRAPG